MAPADISLTILGFGMFVVQYGTAFDHGGRWPGYRTHVTHQLETGVTIAVQTNRDGRVDMLGLVAQIAELVSNTE